MQLSLFASEPRPKPRYPWMDIFPNFMPEVNGLAQMNSVILPDQGYCYGDPVRITAIDGDNVTCVVEHQSDPEWWKNGTTYQCTMNDLWPIP